MEKGSKIRLLKLWEILCRDSDEENPLTTVELLDKLKNEGISCNRKTLYSDIRTLNENGYEVFCERGQHYNRYYVADRSFDTPELRILLDAVQAASFVSERKTARLIDKIAALGGSNRAELLKNNTVKFNAVKHSNENVIYGVSEIGDAIREGNKLSFRYFDYCENGGKIYRKEGARYTVNPLATVFTNDNYYLLCYHDNHPDAASYRVDRMTDVKAESEKANIKKRPANLDVSEHRRQAFSMFAGETARVRFHADKSIIDTIYDKFGENVSLFSLDENTVQLDAEVQLSPVFFGWCLSFGDKLKLVSPKSVVIKLADYLKELYSVYFPDPNLQ